MREIKFRAWHKEDKRMGMVTAINFLSDQPQVAIGKDDLLECRDWWYEHNTILMQYTGLKDKNGKEIYEGDIMEIYNGVKEVVKWDKEQMGFATTSENGWFHPGVDCAWELAKVIGNIYENPKLLKDK